ncbi:amidase signature enzyme [Amniculicola lignicola CBS 123094]|uniref:Amidase signature enzyme n=1 Tax=Amniculicola lignicola CBS 123094 TaxID=1392246 RepID=A0A6A5WXJ4_9PLEO|nr:amidase signature enzyme [Amniculicola lignicola CBS 123094]
MEASNTPVHTFNRPTAKLFPTSYEEPPKPTNPIVRGLSLYYGGSLISSVDALSRYLWSNAGFTILRNITELHNYQPRADPSVIPAARAPSSNPTAHPTLTSRAPPLHGTSSKFPSIVDYYRAYTSASITPLDVVGALLPLVRRDLPEPTEHSIAFLQTRVGSVIAAAEASAARWKSGAPLGLLDGVPIAVKDELDVDGYEKKLGSNRIFKTDGTSWCVQKLIDGGAIVFGKSTMHELGTDTTNNNPVHGTPPNPYGADYYCGGSSGGSAYAVAAGLVPLAVGADGGGSIRIPASFCGIYGLKTSHGRISRLPTLNIGSSCGVVGPMGANMIDVEVGFRLMASPDPVNSTSSCFPIPSVARIPARYKVLGIYKPWFDRADPAVRTACEAAIDYLRDTLGYKIVDVSIPMLHAGQIAHALTCLTELAAGNPGSVSDLQPANKILISVGRHTPASDYLLAQRLRELLMQHLSALYEEHPGLVIVTPTTTLPGWHINGGAQDLKYGISDANMSTRNMEYVWVANLSGCPCLQAPVGYIEGKGEAVVPVGLMGMTEWGADEEAIGWGYDVENWLHEGLVEGRRLPKRWVDVLDMATKGFD